MARVLGEQVSQELHVQLHLRDALVQPQCTCSCGSDESSLIKYVRIVPETQSINKPLQSGLLCVPVTVDINTSVLHVISNIDNNRGTDRDQIMMQNATGVIKTLRNVWKSKEVITSTKLSK